MSAGGRLVRSGSTSSTSSVRAFRIVGLLPDALCCSGSYAPCAGPKPPLFATQAVQAAAHAGEAREFIEDCLAGIGLASSRSTSSHVAHNGRSTLTTHGRIAMFQNAIVRLLLTSLIASLFSLGAVAPAAAKNSVSLGGGVKCTWVLVSSVNGTNTYKQVCRKGV